MPADETVLEAAESQGVPIVHECLSGICGTCVARCTSGQYVIRTSVGLSGQEKSQRRILACQTRLSSDCVIELDYPLGSNSAQLVSGEVSLERIERLSPHAALVVLDVSRLPAPLDFKPGQFAQLRVPGTDQWRSYSFAHAPRSGNEVEFLVRMLPDGVMSDYLRQRAKPGDRLGFRASRGSFFLRSASRPVLLIAGGTGLSAILAIAEQLVRNGATQPIRIAYGVTTEEDLVLLPRLEQLAANHAALRWECVVLRPSPQWRGRVGVATDLLSKRDLADGRADVYACGPPAMVDAVRTWLNANGLAGVSLYYEKFVPSGTRLASRAAPAAAAALSASVASAAREKGRGTAVVIGGSIAGMAAAKVLAAHCDRVIVLEKDRDHGRTDGRPGAAQGWHLHHLLMAGQRALDSMFPGIIDDMVAAGALRVDMGEQYRIMLAGSWKKAGRSGIEIVCAGRPLLEWCVRRRLDRESRVEYRYESEATDLVFDAASRSVVGVVVERDGARDLVPAAIVIDAAGKNSPVPEMLQRLGVGSPEVEEDCLNCFYSTMQHRVPPERIWKDKVMVICYAQRPQQRHYAAQYYTDSSRTTLSTSLVGYDCHKPPRNAEEFREFARLMPALAIGNELEGLEPCSPVYNFRYPEMRRLRYERMPSLPAGLVAVGDALCSADPVSGAGMTKALLEVAELRSLLRDHRVNDRELVRAYYARAKRIADRIWSVIREQNLRYPWILDVRRKRTFYFRLHTWYVDRLFELIHDDAETYRRYLEVTHFVQPPSSLMSPRVIARVLSRWARTRLAREETLIERNFGNGRAGEFEAPPP